MEVEIRLEPGRREPKILILAGEESGELHRLAQRLSELAPGPSPLKWRETLPYAPFVLLLCDGLPLLLYWLDDRLNQGSFIAIPLLSGLLLPFVLLPVGGFFAGVSLGKRQGVCPLYPAACFVCYLPMLSLVSTAELFHCLLVSVPALAGNVTGWLYRRAVPKKGREPAC